MRFPPLTPVIKNLLIINVALFLLSNFFTSGTLGEIMDMLALRHWSSD